MTVSALRTLQPYALPARWRYALPATLLMMGWTGLLFRETAAGMVAIWSRSETFTHGFLVLPVVLWLIWRQRVVLTSQTPQPAPAVLIGIACAALIWLLGELAAINGVTQFAFVALLVLSVPLLLGWQITRLIAFPLGFLFFSVPLGEFLLPQFMEWTANFTVAALRLSGIPVYRQGLDFVIPSGNWSVVEACSGVRYLIASLMVGALFAYLNYQSNKRRLLFVAVAAVVPVVANWMRAYLIVMLGHLSENTLAAGVDHLIYGWLFFGVVILLMFLVGARWSQPDRPLTGRVSGAFAMDPALPGTRLAGVTAGLALLLVLPHVVMWRVDQRPAVEPVQLSAPVALSPGWQPVGPGVGDFKPAFENTSAEFNASYANQGQLVGLYFGHYQRQDAGHKLVSSDNVLASSQDPHWAVLKGGKQTLLLDGQRVAVRVTELHLRGQRQLPDGASLVAWQFYWIGGVLTANDYLAKVYGALRRLTGKSEESAVIVVYGPADQPGGADAALRTFLVANYGAIDALLRSMQTRR